MLTNEILDANTELASLTAEQKSAIVTLSRNDEDSVISARIGEIYGGLDTDILAASGVEKDGTEKTYNYMKRAFASLKEKANNADDLQNQVTTLTRDKEKLQKAIADGSADSETKKQLAQVQKDFANITAQYNELNTKFSESEENHRKEIFGMQIENEFAKAKGGFKFKSNLPEPVVTAICSQAEAQIKAMQTEMIDDGKGGKVLAFKNADGSILRNTNNKLLPYTAGELLQDNLNKMGILDDGKSKAGSGTGAQTPKNNATMDISGAKTQIEAMAIISESLMARGLTKGSKAYQDEQNKIWADNNVSNLPIQ